MFHVRLRTIITREVTTMSQNNGAYSSEGLDGLLRASGEANAYFSSLPRYVQEMVMERRHSIQSEDELRRYAENIVQGDK